MSRAEELALVVHEVGYNWKIQWMLSHTGVLQNKNESAEAEEWCFASIYCGLNFLRSQSATTRARLAVAVRT